MNSCLVFLIHELGELDGKMIYEAECGCNERATCGSEAAADRWHALHLAYPDRNPAELATEFGEMED